MKTTSIGPLVLAAIAALIVLVLAVFALLFLRSGNEEGDRSDETAVGGAVQEETASPMPLKEGDAEKAGDVGAGAASSGGEDDLVAITGVGGVHLRGRVLDLEGKPVVNAAIECFEAERIGSRVRSPMDAAWSDSKVCTRSDGRFAIDLPRGLEALTFLRFVHPEFKPETKAVAAAVKEYDGSLRLDDVLLKRAFFVDGIVVDGQGNPVAGCPVSAPGMPWDERTRWSKGDLLLTDDEGRFRLAMKSNEPVRVTACLDELGIGWTGEVVPGQGREVPDVRIRLQNGGAIAGRLLDTAGGPAVGREIGIKSEIAGYAYKRFCVADGGGGFRFDALPDAVFAVFVEPAGVEGGVGRPVDCILMERVAAGTEDLVLSLPPSSRIALHLRSTDGEVVDVEPEVSFYQLVKEPGEEDERGFHCGLRWSGQVEQPEPGTFVYGGLASGQFRLDIRTAGYAPRYFVEATVPPPPATGEIVVELSPRRIIEGTVRFADGRIARGVCVACEREDRHFSNRRKALAAFTGKGIRGRVEKFSSSLRVTDDAGAFSFDNLTHTGKYAIICSVNGLETHREWPVEITDEEPRVVLSVTLPEASGSIMGSVLDPRGAPLAGALVLAWNGEEFFYKCRSDEEGRYRFDGLLDGQYIVDARVLATTGMNPGTASFFTLDEDSENIKSFDAFNAVISGGGTFNLDLVIADPWNSSVMGRIDPGRQPFPDSMFVGYSRLEFEGESHERRRPTAVDLFHYSSSVSDEDPRVDRFRFSHLPVGRYRVTVRWGAKQRFRIASAPFDLGPSEARELTVRLALVGLEGQVVDGATGAGVEGAKIVLRSGAGTDDARSFEIESGREGSFACNHMPAGTYDLFVAHKSFAPHLKRAFLLDEGGDRIGVRIELEPGCAVSGKLKWAGIPDGEDQPAFNYHYVYIECPETGRYWPRVYCKVNRDGTFNLTGMPRGEVKLVVNCPRDVEVERTVTVPAPKDSNLVIQVPRVASSSSPTGGGSTHFGSF